ncbi:MAG: hypothetical protein OXU78_06015 [Deltaproteobacteria bacterium]|nr:hypothetical protein [Deltaproteobacteria bacterium]
MKNFTIREYQTLGPEGFGDVQIPKGDFEAIRNYVIHCPAGEGQTEKSRVLETHRGLLRARDYVGVLQTRSGTTIEILPKLSLAGVMEKQEQRESREKQIFLRMLRRFRGTNFKNLDEASIQALRNFPLLDVFISLFLDDLIELTRRGLAHGYEEVEENLLVLRGKLLLAGQLRHNLVHRERFFVRHEIFSANRPINRLLKSTLLLLHQKSGNPDNQRRIRQARFYFEEIPKSDNITADLQRARIDRGMPLYERLLPWARLFLQGNAPATWRGSHLAIALFFPMWKVFEDYMAYRLHRELSDWKIQTQHCIAYLIEKNHLDSHDFRMKPDFVATKSGEPSHILDAKWKQLDMRTHMEPKHYNISQSDLYQLYAYGKKIEGKEGRTPKLTLLYPWNENFTRPLQLLYEDDLRLEARPVRLDDEDIPIF